MFALPIGRNYVQKPADGGLDVTVLIPVLLPFADLQQGGTGQTVQRLDPSLVEYRQAAGLIQVDLLFRIGRRHHDHQQNDDGHDQDGPREKTRQRVHAATLRFRKLTRVKTKWTSSPRATRPHDT